MKLKLDNVTLVCIDCVNYGEALTAIRKSMFQVDFAKALFLTDIKAYNPNFPFEIIKIPKISSKAEYSRFVMKELYKYVETEYVLIIQHDGYVLNADSWDDVFFNYDVVAPAWLYTDGRNCGCGGFTLRTKRLMDILGTDDFISVTDVEDDNIGRLYRGYLETKYDIKFAPDDICDRFGFELREPIQKTFGFHGKFHKEFQPTVVIKRSGALGDCVAVEPLLRYYHDKGYKVAIDMPLHIAMMYSQHHYPVFHVTQLTDKRVPYTLIDLDGSYEANPKQLHLKSYYDKAGITDGEIRNPKLNFQITDQNRLFAGKYVVIHNDVRDQPYRNIYGVDWDKIVEFLKRKDYTIIQVGMGRHEPIEGAIQMRTVTINLLMYLVAGADAFIGIDSGVAAIAASFNIPSAIFFGSVAPEVIHPDLTNIHPIQYDKPCDTPKCWSSVVGGFTGKPCVVNEQQPPCTQYTTEMVLETLNKMF